MHNTISPSPCEGDYSHSLHATSLDCASETADTERGAGFLGINTKFAVDSNGALRRSDAQNLEEETALSSCDPPEGGVKSFQDRVASRVTTLRSRRDVWMAVSSVLPRERVAWCRSRVIPGRGAVEVWHVPDHAAGVLAGVASCGMVHVCPYCAARVAAHRAEELRRGIQSWIDDGGVVTMLTFTLRHSVADTLSGVLGVLRDAHRFLVKSRSYRSLVSGVGAAGTVRALEVTLGCNGWHPHFHVLLFHRSRRFRFGALAEHWLDALERFGGSGASGIAFHARTVDAASAASWYVNVAGCAREVALGPAIKKGRHGSLTFWQLALQSVSESALRLKVYEYFLTMRGYHVLQWSRGLRDRLGLGDEQGDQEVLDSRRREGGVRLAVIPASEWLRVVANDAVVDVLEAAIAGDAESLYALMDGIGVAL